MPKDEFDLEDTNFNGAETSLDDFFQPADKAAEKKPAKGPSVDDFFAPAGGEPKPSAETMPVSKKGMKPAPDVFDDIKSDEPAGPEAPPVPLGGEGAEAAAPEKGFLARNWIIFVIAALVIVLGGSGGFLAVNYFLKPKTTVAQAPARPAAVKPKPVKPKPAAAPAAPAPGSAETKPAEPMKPAPAAAAKPAEPMKPAPAAGTKPAPGAKPVEPVKPAPAAKPGSKEAMKPAGKPAPAAKPAVAMIVPPAKVPAPKPGHVPVPTSGSGEYMVQVGSYMLESSKKGPEATLESLGYSQFHYVAESRRLTVYHLYAGKDLSRGDADALATKLEGMGYAPAVVPEGMAYRVEVYSYGSSGVAKSTRSKLLKAGIKNLEIKSETKVVTLSQLRVGGFSSQALAKKALADIRRGGLRGAVIVREKP